MICKVPLTRTSHRLLAVLVAAVAVLVVPAVASANTVTITSQSEGAITISNGDFVSAGYQFTISGNHPDTEVQIADAIVTITGPCSNGGTGTLTIPLSGGPYDDPANSNAELPSGPAGEDDPASFQGSVTASVCGGSGTLNGSSGAVFTADVQASNTSNPIQIQFHYRDPNAKNMGNVNCQTAPTQPASVCGASWSSTSGLTPDAFTPGFTIAKKQQIAGTGSFTTATLTGAVGQTVDYQIVVTNTGNTPLTLGGFTDAHCDSGTLSGGPGANPVAAGASTTYTCDHVLTSTDQTNGSYSNVATVTGTPPSGEGTPTTTSSNTVVVDVPAAPAPGFTILKEQQIAGTGTFTTATLTGAVGQTVDYQILVTNTGNTSLTFSAFTDAHCDSGTLSGGPGANPVASGASTTYTCDHVLTSTDQTNGSYSNFASVTGTPPSGQGSPITNTSNTVVVNVPVAPAPGFTIAKQQQIAGTGTFTTATLTGAVGQTVDYEIVVTNTGNTSLTFSAFTDAHCDAGTLAGGPGTNSVASGGSTTYFCDHVLTSTDQTNGSYSNVASVTGTPPIGAPITNTSNTVVVNVPVAPAPGFTIAKLQQIAGAGSFTTATLTGAVGQTVDYQIVVTNTGNTPLTFSALTDAHCDAGTLAGGPGGNSVASGGSTTYFCDHVLTSTDQANGSYANVASVTGTPPSGQGSPITNTSNTVVVNVPIIPAPGFTIAKQQQIAGTGTFTTATLTGAVGQTVDYEIVVTNTGNTPLSFSGFTDPHCDAATLTGGPGGNPVASGASTTYTCDHVLTSTDQTNGSYSNVASVTGTPPSGQGSPITNTSNTLVVVNVPATPSPGFTIAKLQQIAGLGSFTTATLTGAVGQTVDYEIVVTNTGNTALTFSGFTDAHCDPATLSGGPGGNSVASGASTTYTCGHLLTSTDQANGSYSNVASVTGTPPSGQGSPITNTSNTVVVNVPATPSPGFTIAKLQQIAGAGSFTTATLTGVVGQTVDYEIVVTNTGNTPLTFSGFADGHCDPGTLAGGPGAGSIAAGASTTYFCDHVLTAADQTNGSYSNVASVTGTPPSGQGSPITNTSNTVVVNVPATPSPGFTIAKLQQIAGAGSFTTATLTGAIGETVDYEIVVTNTGNTALTFSGFTDGHCDLGTLAGGPGASSIAAGASTTYLCDHVLTATDQANGSYSNVASVTGTPPSGQGSPITNTSNTVVVNLPATPSPGFTIVKQQQIAGAGSFTTATLTGAVGQTVDYEIVVTNTGNTPLTFSGFADPRCDSGTLSGGPSGNSLAPGTSTTYTCDHVLTAADQTNGSYSNVASVTGTPPSGQGSPITNSSNTVQVTLMTVPAISLVKQQQITQAGTGPSAGAYTGHATVPSGAPGEVDNYLVTVTNTGNSTLDLNYADTLCTNLQGPVLVAGTGSLTTDLANGEPQVTPGTAVTYTCQHTLSATDANPYTNTASVVGMVPQTGATVNASDSVQASIMLSSSLSIVKSQRDVTSNVPSDGSYTTSTINAAVGDTTISYHITVTNTGQTALGLVLTDSPCSPASIQGPSAVSGTLTGSTLSAGGVAYFACSHVISSADGQTFTNTATVTGTPPGGTPVTSPPSSVVVTVTTPPPGTTTPNVLTTATATPALAVVKKQKLPGGTYTTAAINATVGQTIDYEVIATNTGNQTLTLTSFSDPRCDAGTIVRPTVTTLAPGQSATWTCSRRVVAGDVPALTNVAVVTVTPPGGSPLSGQGAVVANVPKPPAPRAAVKACVAATSGAKLTTTTSKGVVTATVTGKHVTTVTFFVDGRKVKTLKKPNAKGHGFAYVVTVATTSFGAHTVSASLSQSTCRGALQAKASFNHPAPTKTVVPKFTG